MGPGSGKKERLLILVSGLAKNRPGCHNLGDFAQTTEVLRRFQKQFPDAELRIVANSLDRPFINDDVEISTTFITFLASPRQGPLGHNAIRVIRAAIRGGFLIWNARRHHRGRKPLFMGESGRRALADLTDRTALVMAGAAVLNDEFIVGTGGLWVILVRAAKGLRLPVLATGQQIGPLNSAWKRMIVRWGFRDIDVLGVRELFSEKEALNLQLGHRVILTGDDAWNLEASSGEQALSALLERSLPPTFIAAQVRYESYTAFASADSPKLAELLDSLAVHFQLPVTFVLFDLHTSRPDQIAAKSVTKHMSSHTHILEGVPSPSLMKAILGRAEFCIGISYHFCVFSSSIGTPTIGIYRSPYMQQKLLGLAELAPTHMLAISATELASHDTRDIAKDFVAERLYRRSGPPSPRTGALSITEHLIADP